MKTIKFLSMAALALVGAVMTGCSSDDDSIISNPQQPENKSNVVTLTTTVGLDSNGEAGARSATRALTSGGVKTFNAGETMAIVYKNPSGTTKAVSAALTAGDITSDGKNATFTFELENPDKTKPVMYIYPAAMAKASIATDATIEEANTVDYTNLNSQNGTLATLSSSLDLATYSAAWENGTSLPAGTLVNQLAVCALTLKDNAGSSTITSGLTQVTVSDGSNTYTVTPTSSTFGEDVIYVAIRPVTAALQYTATDGTKNYTKTATSREYAAGNFYNLGLRMDPVVTDLSMVDCAGNARANGMSTANCYMVHTAGKYKLPLVYGNAIKAGAANTAAYNPGGTTSTNYCANFVNHAGAAINAPWITKSTSGTGVNKGMGINVTSAELLWQDAQGLVTAVGIDGDYLTLTVGKDAATQEGNAVIAVKAGSTIVWSWHIWVTKQTFATQTTITASGYGYKVTPVNLGWVGNATSGATGYCTFYQWGRKDAFIPSTGNGNTNHTAYDINNATVTAISYAENNATNGTNIQHPTVHYRNTSTDGPCTTSYYNMWDAQQTSTAIAAAATKKTVYDPCPPGFCVPTSGLYNYMESQGKPTTTFSNGYTYRGVFFPASGYRGYSSGVLSLVGTYGYYWSATPNSGYEGRIFYLSSSVWDFSSYYRATGCPVRAVAE